MHVGGGGRRHSNYLHSFIPLDWKRRVEIKIPLYLCGGLELTFNALLGLWLRYPKTSGKPSFVCVRPKEARLDVTVKRTPSVALSQLAIGTVE